MTATATTENVKFTLLPGQADFVYDEHRFCCNSGGVGSGKTYSVVIKSILKLADNPGIFGLLGAATFPQLRDTIMADFIELCPKSFIKEHNKATHTFIFINGSKLIFRPFDKASKFKSLNLGFVGIEEMSDISEDVFKMLRTRIRQKGYNCQLFGATNASNFQNWVYKYFIEEPIKNSKIFYSVSTDNYHLPQEYLDDLDELKKTNPEYHLRMVEGKWGNLEGLIYNLPRSQILDEKDIPKTFHRIIAGLDFGFTHPTGILIIGIIENKYYVIHEFKKTGFTSGDIEKELKKLVDKYKQIASIFSDSARPEIIEDLQRAGLPARKSRKDVFLGIQHIKTLIGGKNLFVSKNCHELIKEFDNYCWDKGSIKEIPIKLMDDLLDALRYACYTEKKLGTTRKSKKLSWA